MILHVNTENTGEEIALEWVCSIRERIHTRESCSKTELPLNLFMREGILCSDYLTN